MTRFARAKGSKSSNERVPEQATSWREMRKELHRESVRKAAEEQIERESSSRPQREDEKVPLNQMKKKINAPVELASFDDYTFNYGVSSNVIVENNTKVKNCKAPKRKEKNPECKEKQNSYNICSDQDPITASSGQSDLCLGKSSQKSNSECVLKKEVNINEFQDKGKNMSDQWSPQETDLKKRKNIADQWSLKRMDFNKEKTICDQWSPQKTDLKKGETISGQWSPQKTVNKPLPNPTFNKNFPKGSMSQTKFDNAEDNSLSKISGDFKGYPVPLEDAETLTDAYNILRKEGLTHQKAMEQIKPERRRAEKRLARLKSMICFRCRKAGHRLSDCPLGDVECDVCFKCGSTTHKYQECKKKGSFVNAKCFICGVIGHLSSQCPENNHGVYPEGGQCKICGEKTHLVKDCPQNKNNKETHPGITEFDDYFDDEMPKPSSEPRRKRLKKVQF